MEDSFRNFVIGSLLSLLFVFCILSFYVSMGNQYGKDTTALTGDYYDFSGINSSLVEAQETAEQFRSATSQTTASNSIFGEGIGFFNGVGAFFSVVFKMFGFIISLFDFVIVGTINIIFANPIISTTVITIVIIIALFGIFRFLKIGS